MINKIIILFLILSISSCHRAKDKIDKVLIRSKREVQKTKENILEYTKALPPQESFEARTGLRISDTIFNIMEVDNYFPLEGEYSIVFNTSSKQINNWIKLESPWGKNWIDGPIPSYILNCNFGLDEVEIGPNTIWLTTQDEVKYVAEEFCCSDDSSLRYHNGRILILDIKNNKVWYSNWDY